MGAFAVLLACVMLAGDGPIGAFTQPSDSQPAFREPGPLVGGEYGARYRGPGFIAYLPARWTITLDDAPGHPQHGERGYARPTGDSGDQALDMVMRFEAFPPEPGRTATLAEYEKHVRTTLASGVPVTVRPLIKDDDWYHPHGGERPGLTFWFTRPGDAGSKPRRFFVHALPRADGRLQTVICSHAGEACRAGSATFTQAGMSLATDWPDKGGVFHRDEAGVVLDCPAGWAPFARGYCGNIWMGSKEERRRSLLPLGTFTPIRDEPDRMLKKLYVELSIVEVLEEPIETLIGPESHLFEFSDGGTGRMSETADQITVVRADGARVVQGMVRQFTPQEREKALALLRGLKLVRPVVETETDAPKTVSAQGVSMTYPGDWRLTMRARGLFGGTLDPIRQPEKGSLPALHVSIARLDDLRAEWDSLCAAPPERRPNGTNTDCNAMFVTDSGWEGFRWTTINDSEGRRGRVLTSSVQYVLPMPDGVSAVHLSGVTTTLHGSELQSVWRTIAESLRRAGDPPAPPAPKPKQS